MGSKLYVGNLPYAVRDHDLHQAFTQFGTVVSARVMMERDTGRSKGFGFVEMSAEAEASAAIEGMNGQPLGSRSLIVNIALMAPICATATMPAINPVIRTVTVSETTENQKGPTGPFESYVLQHIQNKSEIIDSSDK